MSICDLLITLPVYQEVKNKRTPGSSVLFIVFFAFTFLIQKFAQKSAKDIFMRLHDDEFMYQAKKKYKNILKH